VDAVLLALGSAVLFGAMTVALRFALRSGGAADLGAVVTTGTGLVVVLFAAALDPETREPLSARELAAFALAGVLAPGLSQILFMAAIRDAGASRSSVVVGTAPLFGATLAIILLDEPFRVPLALGAALIVVAGVLLVHEPERPQHLRLIGLAYALVATVVFSVRDVFIRWYSGEASLGSLGAAAASLAAGWLLLAGFAAASRRGEQILPALRREVVRFVPAGVLFGVSYVLLFEAYFRGRVTVVSPLVATESLWTVLLSAVFLKRSELVGPRLVLGASLVVAGGVLISAFR
jgi:drug/metabolite transporter (DMT)-like permease